MKKIHSVFVWLCAGLLVMSAQLGALVPPPPQQVGTPAISVLPGLTPQPAPAVVNNPASVQVLPPAGIRPGTPAPFMAAPAPVQGIQPQAPSVLPAVAAPVYSAPMQVNQPPVAVPSVSPVFQNIAPAAPRPIPAPFFPGTLVQPMTSALSEVAKPSDIFPQEEPVKAIDSIALQAFPEGTRAVLVFVGSGDKDTHLLKVTRGIYVAPTGKDPFDPKCQFKIRRKGTWIGFESDYLKGRTLQSDPKNFIVHFPDSNFVDDNNKTAHWSAQFIDPRDATGIVRLQNRATQGFLNFPYEPWAESLAWTAFKEKTPATIAGDLARLKIIKVSELSKEVAKASGEKDYVYTPRLRQKLTPVYSDGWKFETPGSGYVIFDVRAKENIVVSFSTVADNLADNMYYLVIGDKKNSCTTIRKRLGGPIFYKHDFKKNAENSASAANNVMQKSSKTFESYWVKVEAGKISYGQGRVLGQNAILEWKDPDKPLKVQFVGFSGGNSKIDFKNIEIGGKDKIATTVVLPTGFNQEPGVLKRVAVGSRKDALEIWGIGVDGALWRWKADSMASNPWERQQAIVGDGSVLTSINNIYLSSNGDLFLISDGKGYRYDWKKLRWNEIDTGMQRLQLISLSGHEGNLWAVANNGAAYQLVKQAWQKRSDEKSALRVVVSPDNEVFVLSQSGKIFRYKGDNGWVKIPSKAIFKDFFAVNKELIFAIDRQQRLWQFTPVSNWAPVAGPNKIQASGIASGSANAAGTIVVVSQKGELYKLRNEGVSEKKIQQMMLQKAPALKSIKKSVARKSSAKKKKAKKKGVLKNARKSKKATSKQKAKKKKRARKKSAEK